jgi:predicted nucleotidyltransferase
MKDDQRSVMTKTNVTVAYEKFREDIQDQVPGKVLLTKVWGSHSHGTELPESDIDFLAVYKWSLRNALSMHPPTETVDHKGPDWQAHEIGKFCQLLLKGNPATIECLFTDLWCDWNPELLGLMEIRNEFINATSLKQYLGYARGQLQRLQAGVKLHTGGGKYSEKWAYHLIRVLLDGKRIAHGDPPVVTKYGHELDLLMSIRRGEWLPDRITDYAVFVESEIDAMKPWSIPEAADERKLNEWLYSARTDEEFAAITKDAKSEVWAELRAYALSLK